MNQCLKTGHKKSCEMNQFARETMSKETIQIAILPKA